MYFTLDPRARCSLFKVLPCVNNCITGYCQDILNNSFAIRCVPQPERMDGITRIMLPLWWVLPINSFIIYSRLAPYWRKWCIQIDIWNMILYIIIHRGLSLSAIGRLQAQCWPQRYIWWYCSSKQQCSIWSRYPSALLVLRIGIIIVYDCLSALTITTTITR